MESSGFFTAELQSDGTYDRVYVAEEFAKYFSLFVGTGVFVQPASQLMVVQADTASMKVKVKAGNAFINGYWYNNSSALQFDVPNANGALDRWDAIMVRHDFIAREARLSYVTGTPAITPSKPLPERSQDAYEICLAHIFVGRGVLKITDANITDTRPNSSICGYVKGLVETVNTTDLFAQFRSAFNQFFDSGSSEYTAFVNSMKAKYNSDVAAITEDYDKFLTAAKGTYDSTVSEYFSKYNSLYINNENSFNSWFETIKGKLSTDIAGSLQNQIDALKTQIGTASGSFVNLPNSFNGGLFLKELQGKSVQNGTPSPDAKVDIVSVGDNGSVVARVTGKNLVQNNAVTSTSGGVTFTVNGDKTITATGTRTTNSVLRLQGDAQNVTFILRKGVTYKAFGRGLSYKDINGNYSLIPTTGLTPTNDIQVTSIYVEIFEGNPLPTTIYPMIYIGDTTIYEPYKEQLVTIPLTQPLRSVGSVYDRVIKKDGLWKIERNNIQEVIQNGVKLAWLDTASIGTSNTRFTVSIGYRGRVNSSILTNRFESTMVVTDAGGNAFFKSVSNSVFGILTTDDEDTIRNKIITWFSSNPTVLIYPTKTTVYDVLPQDIQDQLNKLQTYQGVTNVFTTDALQPTLSVSYGKTDTSALSLYGTNMVDSKVDKAGFLEFTSTITTTFTGTTAPYTQTIAVSGIKSTDKPMICPVYSSDNATAVLQKKAWSCIDEIDTTDGNIVVKCFSKKPVTAIPIQLKVVRG